MRPRKKAAFFLLKTQFENVGDALINRELVKLTARRIPTVIEVSRVPDYFIHNLGMGELASVSFVKGGLAALCLRMIKFRMKGGTPIFFLVPGGNVGEKSRSKYLANWAYNQFLRLLKLSGVELVHIGVSYERLGPRYQAIIRQRAVLLKRNFVRDQLSADYLTSVGIDFDGITPDLAFGLEFDYKRLNARTSGPAGGAIAFSYRTDLAYIRKADITAFTEGVIARFPDRPLKFISQVKRDNDFMMTLYEACKNGCDQVVTFVDLSERLNDYNDVYGDCDVLFSNRLHALLLSLSAGVIPVPTLYTRKDSKIRGVFASIALGESIIDLDNVPPVGGPLANVKIGHNTVTKIQTSVSDLNAGIDSVIG